MIRNRNDEGKYIRKSFEERKVTSIRMTNSVSDKLKQFAKDQGKTTADVIEEWVLGGFGGDSDLINAIKIETLKEVKRIEKIGEQSAKYKRIRQAINNAVKKVKKSM